MTIKAKDVFTVIIGILLVILAFLIKYRLIMWAVMCVFGIQLSIKQTFAASLLIKLLLPMNILNDRSSK